MSAVERLQSWFDKETEYNGLVSIGITVGDETVSREDAAEVILKMIEYKN